MPRSCLFTSESVTEGHPDKVADQISDAVLDALLTLDPNARVACETLVKTGLVLLAGEVRAAHAVDYAAIARKTVLSIGYNDSRIGFDGTTCAVLNAVEAQSSDIAQGVDASATHEQGAGDQGMMFGYACDETPELMPAPIMLAHRIARRLAEVRKDGRVPFLRPDGKTQVTYLYEDGRPVAIDTVLVSSQHAEDAAQKEVHDAIVAEVIEPCLPKSAAGRRAPRMLINPTGRFVIGGPLGDAGLTGRKIIVDTYGGMGRHGGGAFSGKDPSKVDRSAAYFARYVAKNIVAAKLAARCEVQLAYAIGRADPVSILVQTFGTAAVDEGKIEAAVRQVFDARPAAIGKRLDLLRPIYQKTAAYGHFGRTEAELRWEATDAAAELAQACGRPV